MIRFFFSFSLFYKLTNCLSIFNLSIIYLTLKKLFAVTYLLTKLPKCYFLIEHTATIKNNITI